MILSADIEDQDCFATVFDVLYIPHKLAVELSLNWTVCSSYPLYWNVVFVKRGMAYASHSFANDISKHKTMQSIHILANFFGWIFSFGIEQRNKNNYHKC